jgi:hypothetical protein
MRQNMREALNVHRDNKLLLKTMKSITRKTLAKRRSILETKRAPHKMPGEMNIDIEWADL